MQRRTFLTGLAGILATGFAPAAASSGFLMPIRKIAAADRTFFLDGKTWDDAVLMKFLEGQTVYHPSGQVMPVIDNWHWERLALEPNHNWSWSRCDAILHCDENGNKTISSRGERRKNFALVQPWDNRWGNAPHVFSNPDWAKPFTCQPGDLP